MSEKPFSGVIGVQSIVSMRTREPLVLITWGDQSGQLSPDEARQHALRILECAEAAESDAFVFGWLTRDIVGTAEDERENWDRIIGEFRKFRLAREGQDE